jgi:hypothetical protein
MTAPVVPVVKPVSVPLDLLYAAFNANPILTLHTLIAHARHEGVEGEGA